MHATPGPWHWKIYDDCSYFGDMGGPMSRLEGAGGEVILDTGQRCEIDDNADARLIAAAPTMAAELSQLEIEIESFIECGMSPRTEWLRDNLASIRAVLASAILTERAVPRDR